MAKLFDLNGKEVEAFTADELKSKQDEAVAEHLKNNPDKTAELTKLQAELDSAKKSLEDATKGGGGASDQQKARLKEAKEAAETALKDTTDKFTNEINGLRETIVGGIKSKALAALSKGDKDLREKIELKYASLMKTGDYKNDEAGIAQAMAEAATIVTGNKVAPSFMDNMSSAGDRGNNQKDLDKKPESENSKAMRSAFGITDKTAEKYGGQDATGGAQK